MSTVTEERGVEVWEAQTKSTIFVKVYDKRSREYKLVRVGGKQGAQRLQISTEDREHNQQLVPDENRALDPFTNGRLIRVDGGSNEGIVVTEQLREFLAVRDVDDFKVLVTEEGGPLDSELSLRRLLLLAAQEGTMLQVECLRDIIDERYSVAKSQRTVLEMMKGPEGSTLSDETIVT